jgi:uncharacterized membrane protein HdeD (DUF308 family)
MQKLMKNWIFTLITCILLAVLAVLTFLDGFDVGGLHIGDRIIHLVAAIALALYTVFAIFPLTVRYKGVLRAFVIGEIVILALTAVAHVCMEWFMIPLISDLEVCAVLGLAIWLRGAVEIVHAYLSGEEQGIKPRVPLWKLLAYILLCAVGVWQLIAPIISDRSFIFVIAAAATVMAVIFGSLTYTNRKAGAEERKKKKAERLLKKAALLKEKEEEQKKAEEAEQKESEPAQLPAPGEEKK